MPRAMTVCSQAGCSGIILQGQGRCANCKREADKARRPDGNPYASAGHAAFRVAVLDRDPICVVCQIRVSTVADHYPNSRRDLEAMGMDPNDPRCGRGVCTPCHNAHTAATSPGGWNASN